MITTGKTVPMEQSEMVAINGGGFAYDLGRILRFIYISAGTGPGTAMALNDWIINDAANQQPSN
jgi:hypothetical protein